MTYHSYHPPLYFLQQSSPNYGWAVGKALQAQMAFYLLAAEISFFIMWFLIWTETNFKMRWITVLKASMDATFVENLRASVIDNFARHPIQTPLPRMRVMVCSLTLQIVGSSLVGYLCLPSSESPSTFTGERHQIYTLLFTTTTSVSSFSQWMN